MPSDKTVGIFSRLLKSFAMRFSGQGGSSSSQGVFYGNGLTTLGLHFPNSRIDYSVEIGDVTQSSIVMAACRWLGSTLPEAPLEVLTADADGKEQPEQKHELAQLIKKPNQYYSGATLWKHFSVDWLTSGNVYWLKIRNARGKIISLWPIPACSIRPCWPSDGSIFISHYVYTVDSQQLVIAPEDIIHFRDGIDSSNTRLGQSPLASLLREIYTDNEAANFSAALLRNFGVPGLLISPASNEGTIDQDQAEFLKSEIAHRTTGDNRGKPFISSGSIKVDTLSFDPQKLDLKALRRVPEERVAAVLGIPAMVLNFGAGLERSTFSNMAEAREAAYESFLIPLQRYICEELDSQLLPELDARENVRTAFDLSSVRVLQQDEDNLYRRLAIGYRAGFIKLSEARAEIGLPTGPEDEIYFTQPAASSTAPAPVDPSAATAPTKSGKPGGTA